MKFSNQVHVFCPNGCGFTHVPESEPWCECAECGTRMTAADEAEFDRVHETLESDQFSTEAVR